MLIFYTKEIVVSIGILAGGKSKRMGQDKAFLQVGGKLVIERIIETVQSLTDDLFINTNTPHQYERFGLRLVEDVIPDKATLGGIYSTIQAANHEHVLIVACDMPLLNQALLRHMISLAATADIVIPLIHPPQPETTHAVYSRNCLPAIKSRLEADKLRVIGFFGEVSIHYLSKEAILPFDPQLHTFINMNTTEEWEQVKRIVVD